VNDDCLKLTTYFGERDRVGGSFLADALLDLYGRHEIETSVLLRGAEGFGLKHHLHTDRLLTLSEDLPVVSVAVDTRARIERLMPDVEALKQTGLVTLERARLLSGELEAVELPEELHEATKLTVYVGRGERASGVPVHHAICDLFHRRSVAGASVLLGVDGTARGRRERARFFGGNAGVPMMIIAVGSGASIAGVLPELGGLLSRPLVTLERIRVCKRDGETIASPHVLPGPDEHGLAVWQKLMVYTSERAKHGAHPIHRVLRGVWGFHGDHLPHGDRLLQLRRRVPVVTIIVDTPERIADSYAIVDELTAERGLVTSEMVPAHVSTAGAERRGGLRLSPHRF
jgi:PII-like signaling protein